MVGFYCIDRDAFADLCHRYNFKSLLTHFGRKTPGSILVQVLDKWLTALGHYVNQY